MLKIKLETVETELLKEESSRLYDEIYNKLPKYMRSNLSMLLEIEGELIKREEQYDD